MTILAWPALRSRERSILGAYVGSSMPSQVMDLVLYPRVSLVENHGVDASGTHGAGSCICRGRLQGAISMRVLYGFRTEPRWTVRPSIR